MRLHVLAGRAAIAKGRAVCGNELQPVSLGVRFDFFLSYALHASVLLL